MYSISKQCHGWFSSSCTHYTLEWTAWQQVQIQSNISWQILDKILGGIVSNISYIPPVPHSRPTTFQSILHLPPRSTVHITMDVTKSFLRYTEHPPDAQRGWDLPPAILTPLRNASSYSADRLYTSALLVDLATPDFSMPYNVIIFSCSLVAYLFGSIFNILTRKFVVVHMNLKKQKWYPCTLSNATSLIYKSDRGKSSLHSELQKSTIILGAVVEQPFNSVLIQMS